ncbi:MAG: hypothetical protein M1826_007310 [Phylliscum demangeonii]|nr:MAG: hypothetical protein M1826_007310 [Phylliscum demangeonii]
MIALPLFLLVATLAARATSLSSSLLNILANTDGSDLYRYPTDLTRGIVPKGLHSHNDYWRDVPFYSALAVGAISIEADVWLYNETLYVGHEPAALTAERTFQSLYIDPILDTLQRQNPQTEFNKGLPFKNGVYDTDPSQTLYLFVDVKTYGPTTWPYVVRALEPLRQAGFLTSYNASRSDTGDTTFPSTITASAITVLGTGNTPLSQIAPLATRDYFYDGPLSTLNATLPTDLAINITASLSPIASASFIDVFGRIQHPPRLLNTTQLALLRDQIRAAHARRILVRYWDLPAWPVAVRDALWGLLYAEGVDLLNVDDVPAAARF